jgi:hypothetical protein
LDVVWQIFRALVWRDYIRIKGRYMSNTSPKVFFLDSTAAGHGERRRIDGTGVGARVASWLVHAAAWLPGCLAACPHVAVAPRTARFTLPLASTRLLLLVLLRSLSSISFHASHTPLIHHQPRIFFFFIPSTHQLLPLNKAHMSTENIQNLK